MKKTIDPDIVELMWLRRERKIKAKKATEGIPPLTFKSNAKDLNNYRIYGNTVNGENVGDLITEGEHAGEYRVPVTVEGQNLFDKNDFIPLNNMYVKQTNATLTIGAGNLGFVLPLNKGNYTVSCLLDRVNLSLFAGIFSTFPNEGDVALSVFKILYNDAKLSFSLANNGFLFMAYNNTAVTQYHTTEEILNALMIVRGSNAPTKYEPYHAPATTNLYLPEQIKMVGDEAEYVNYKEQKQHFADGTSIDVALPALPTFKGTNMLSVGTEVQPSKVLIKT